jgi:hypothetical protein
MLEHELIHLATRHPVGGSPAPFVVAKKRKIFGAKLSPLRRTITATKN